MAGVVHPVQYPETDAEVAANPWVEVDEAYWHNMLGCVPPARWKGKAFAVGEPYCHVSPGWRVVHRVVVGLEDGRYFTKPYPLASFDPDVFVKEVLAQIAAA